MTLTGGKSNNIRYEAYGNTIVIGVGPYSYGPVGTAEEWIEIAEQYKKEKRLEKVTIEYELQDKETGYCRTKIFKTI